MTNDDLHHEVKHAEVVSTEAERESARAAASKSSKVVYEVIRLEGLEALSRPALSLIFSGIAAGILISFSMLGEATLRSYLPEAPSSYLIGNAGYSLGFLLVILCRMQLFTENTITTVLPFMVSPSAPRPGCSGESWGFGVLSLGPTLPVLSRPQPSWPIPRPLRPMCRTRCAACRKMPQAWADCRVSPAASPRVC